MKHKLEAYNNIMQLFNSKVNFFVQKRNLSCVISIQRQHFSFLFKYLHTNNEEKSKRDKDKMYTHPHTYSLDLPVQM